MKEVPLTRGFVAIVDDEDYDFIVRSGPWHIANGHARHSVAPGLQVQMHTLISGWDLVDHADGNGLNNRRSNLRPATYQQNARNRGMRTDNTSGFKGVHYHRVSRKWRACIGIAPRQMKHLGLFATREEAALAYDAAAVDHFGEFARLNFPLEIAS